MGGWGIAPGGTGAEVGFGAGVDDAGVPGAVPVAPEGNGGAEGKVPAPNSGVVPTFNPVALAEEDNDDFQSDASVGKAASIAVRFAVVIFSMYGFVTLEGQR